MQHLYSLSHPILNEVKKDVTNTTVKRYVKMSRYLALGL